MPIKSAGYAAHAVYSSTEPLRPWQYEIPDPSPNEVIIEVHYSGICHSDVSTSRSDWYPVKYPLVTGHEFTGLVKQVGDKVTKHKLGDRVAVGPIAGSCGKCEDCQRSAYPYCKKAVWTYSGTTQEGYYTQGGHGRFVVVPENYVTQLPAGLPMDVSAPLMCGGITVYSPLKHNKIHEGGKKVGIVGIGGLGHLAVQFAAAWGNEVIALSRNTKKEVLAKQLGAKRVLVSSDADAMAAETRTFDFILDTTTAQRNLGPFVELLKVEATYCIVGVPPTSSPLNLPLFALISGRRKIEGSSAGSQIEVEEMLKFCEQKKILPMCEMTTEDKINEAFERVDRGDVMFRFVIDVKNSAPAIEN